MRKTILWAYIALISTLLLPFWLKMRDAPGREDEPPAVPSDEEAEAHSVPAPSALCTEGGLHAPEKIKVLDGENIIEMDMHDYIVSVVAAEMPADFHTEALKAQAVAARSYAMHCAAANKHGGAQVCTDYSCCQACISKEQMRKNWGDAFGEKYKKISSAETETDGQYLSYAGEPVFAAFHSSSYGATEACGEIWEPRPYLLSVSSPEDENTVPDFISTLECAPIDFRDCLLSAVPEADFTGAPEQWLGRIERDESGRVSAAELGGVMIKGTRLRELFSLRSTSFELEYLSGKFVFTVRGYGHGVGMSQYGAELMAGNGADYTQILAHYYPGTVLTK